MSLAINPDIADSLPRVVTDALDRMDYTQQKTFVEFYLRKKRSNFWMIILAVLFPVQLFLLDRIGLGIVFWLTAGGLWVWWFIEIFLTPKRVRAYNEELALSLLGELKMAYA